MLNCVSTASARANRWPSIPTQKHEENDMRMNISRTSCLLTQIMTAISYNFQSIREHEQHANANSGRDIVKVSAGGIVKVTAVAFPQQPDSFQDKLSEPFY